MPHSSLPMRTFSSPAGIELHTMPGALPSTVNAKRAQSQDCAGRSSTAGQGKHAATPPVKVQHETSPEEGVGSTGGVELKEMKAKTKPEGAADPELSHTAVASDAAAKKTDDENKAPSKEQKPLPPPPAQQSDATQNATELTEESSRDTASSRPLLDSSQAEDTSSPNPPPVIGTVEPNTIDTPQQSESDGQEQADQVSSGVQDVPDNSLSNEATVVDGISEPHVTAKTAPQTASSGTDGNDGPDPATGKGPAEAKETSVAPLQVNSDKSTDDNGGTDGQVQQQQESSGNLGHCEHREDSTGEGTSTDQSNSVQVNLPSTEETVANDGANDGANDMDAFDNPWDTADEFTRRDGVNSDLEAQGAGNEATRGHSTSPSHVAQVGGNPVASPPASSATAHEPAAEVDGFAVVDKPEVEITGTTSPRREAQRHTSPMGWEDLNGEITSPRRSSDVDLEKGLGDQDDRRSVASMSIAQPQPTRASGGRQNVAERLHIMLPQSARRGDSPATAHTPSNAQKEQSALGWVKSVFTGVAGAVMSTPATPTSEPETPARDDDDLETGFIELTNAQVSAFPKPEREKYKKKLKRRRQRQEKRAEIERIEQLFSTTALGGA